MAIKEIIKFITEDGIEHSTLEKAKSHVVKMDLEKKIRKLASEIINDFGDGYRIEEDGLVCAFIDKQQEIIKILQS